MPVNLDERILINPSYDGVVMLSPDELLFNDAKPRPDGRKIFHIFEKYFDEDYTDEKNAEYLGHNSEEEFLRNRNELFLKASDTSFYNIQQILGKNGISLEQWVKEKPSLWPPSSTVPSSCQRINDNHLSQMPSSLSKFLNQNSNSKIQSNSAINSHILSSLPKSILVRPVKTVKKKEAAVDDKVSSVNNFKVPQDFKKRRCKSLLITKSSSSLCSNQCKTKTSSVEPGNKSYFEKLHTKRILSPLATASDTTTTTSSNNTTLTWKVRKADINEHRKRKKETVSLEEEIKRIISQFNFSPEKSDPAHDNDPEETDESSESLKKYLLKNIKNFRKDSESQDDAENVSNSDQNSGLMDAKGNLCVSTLENQTSDDLRSEIQIGSIKTEFSQNEMKLDDNFVPTPENQLQFNNGIPLKSIHKIESPSPPPVSEQDTDGECKEGNGECKDGNALSKWIKSIKNREASTTVKFLPDKKKEVCLLSSNMKARKNSIGSQEIYSVEKKENVLSCYEQNSMINIGMLQQEHVANTSVPMERDLTVCDSGYLYLENSNQETLGRTETLPVIHHVGHEVQAQQKYLFENPPKEHYVHNALLRENSSYQKAVDGLLSLNTYINTAQQGYSQTPSPHLKFSAKQNIPQNLSYMNPEEPALHDVPYVNQEQNTFDHYINQESFSPQQFHVNTEIASHTEYLNPMSNSTQLPYASEEQNTSHRLVFSNPEQNPVLHHSTYENSEQNLHQFVGYENSEHPHNFAYSNFVNNTSHNLTSINKEQNSAQHMEYVNQEFMHNNNTGFDGKVKHSEPYYNSHVVDENFPYQQQNVVTNYAETLSNALGMTNESITSAVDSNEICTQSYSLNGGKSMFESKEIPETIYGSYNHMADINGHAATQSENFNNTSQSGNFNTLQSGNFNTTSEKLVQNTIQSSGKGTAYSSFCKSGIYDWSPKDNECKQYNSEENYSHAGKELNNFSVNRGYSNSTDVWHLEQNMNNMNIIKGNNNNTTNNNKIKMCDQVIRAMLNIDMNTMENFEDCRENGSLNYNNLSVANNNNNNNNNVNVDVQSCIDVNNAPSISFKANDIETVKSSLGVTENGFKSLNCESEEDLERIEGESEEEVEKIVRKNEDQKYEPFLGVKESSVLPSDISELPVTNDESLPMECADVVIAEEQVSKAECEESPAEDDALLATKTDSESISDEKLSTSFLADDTQIANKFLQEEDAASKDNISEVEVFTYPSVESVEKGSETFFYEKDETSDGLSNGKGENHALSSGNICTVVKTEFTEETESPSETCIKNIETYLTKTKLYSSPDQMLLDKKENSLWKDEETVHVEGKIPPVSEKIKTCDVRSEEGKSEVSSNENLVPVTTVVKHESPENIKIENTQIFKEEGNIPLIKTEPVDESETSVDLNGSFGEDTKNIKEMKIEDLQDENNLRDHLSTNEDIKSMNSREDFPSINDVSVEEVIKHEGGDAHYLNSDLVKQLMIKPAEEEGGDGEREEEVGVKKSKALDIAENERISLKEVSDSEIVVNEKEKDITRMEVESPSRMKRKCKNLRNRKKLSRMKELLRSPRKRRRTISVKKSKKNKILKLTEGKTDSQVEEASTDLNLKKKILVKSSLKAGKRLRYIENRGWFKIIKRKMDNKNNNNNCNINSDEEKDFERKNGISKEDPFSCSECNYSSYKANLFKRHQMSHLSVKKFKCLHCSYSTNFNSYLKEHSVIHSNNRPFKCSYCDFASKLKSNLKKHENTHFKKSNELTGVKDLCTTKDNSTTMKKVEEEKEVTVSMLEKGRFRNVTYEAGDTTGIVQSEDTSSPEIVPPSDGTKSDTEYCPSFEKVNRIKTRKRIGNTSKSLRNRKRLKENPSVANNGSLKKNPSVANDGSLKENPSVANNGSLKENPSVANNGSLKENPSEANNGSLKENPSVANNGSLKENPSVANDGSSETQDNSSNFVVKKFVCSECELTSHIRRIVVRHVRKKHKEMNIENLIKVVEEPGENYNNNRKKSVIHCRRNLQRNIKPEDEKKRDLGTNDVGNSLANSLKAERDFLHHDKNLSSTVRQNLVTSKTTEERSPYESNCDVIDQQSDSKTNCRVVVKLHKLSNLQPLTNERNYDNSGILDQIGMDTLDKGARTTCIDEDVHSPPFRLKKLETEELTGGCKSLLSSNPKATDLKYPEGIASSSPKSINGEASEDSTNIFVKDIQSSLRFGNKMKSPVKGKKKNRKTKYNVRSRKKVKLNMDNGNPSELKSVVGCNENNININEIHSHSRELESDIKVVSDNETTMTPNGEKILGKDFDSCLYAGETNRGVLVANTYDANCDNNISLHNLNDSILNSSNLSLRVSEVSGSLAANLNGNLNSSCANDDEMTSPMSDEKNISHSISDSVTNSNNLMSSKLKRIRQSVNKDETIKGKRKDDIQSGINREDFKRKLRSKAVYIIASSDPKGTKGEKLQQPSLTIESNLAGNFPSDTNELNFPCTETEGKCEDLHLSKSEGECKKSETTVIPESYTLNDGNVSPSKKDTPFQKIKSPFNCPHCSYSTNVKLFFEKHKKTHDTSRSRKRSQSKTLKKKNEIHGKTCNEIQPEYQCPHCEFSASTKATLESHTLIHKTKKINISKGKEKKLCNDIICNKCKVTFTVKSSLNRHFKRKHGGINVNNVDDIIDETVKMKSMKPVPESETCMQSNLQRKKKAYIKVPNNKPKLTQNLHKRK